MHLKIVVLLLSMISPTQPVVVYSFQAFSDAGEAVLPISGYNRPRQLDEGSSNVGSATLTANDTRETLNQRITQSVTHSYSAPYCRKPATCDVEFLN